MLTEHGTVDARAHPEEMLDRVLVVERVQVVAEHIRAYARVLRQEIAHVLKGAVEALSGDVDLGSVAGAQHHRLRYVRPMRQIEQRLVDVVGRDRDLLEHIQRSAGVVESDRYKRHCHPVWRNSTRKFTLRA